MEQHFTVPTASTAGRVLWELPPEIFLHILGFAPCSGQFYAAMLALNHDNRTRLRGAPLHLSFRDSSSVSSEDALLPTAEALAALIGPCKMLQSLELAFPRALVGCGRAENQFTPWIDAAFSDHLALESLRIPSASGLSNPALNRILGHLPHLTLLDIGCLQRLISDRTHLSVPKRLRRLCLLGDPLPSVSPPLPSLPPSPSPSEQNPSSVLVSLTLDVNTESAFGLLEPPGPSLRECHLIGRTAESSWAFLASSSSVRMSCLQSVDLTLRNQDCLARLSALLAQSLTELDHVGLTFQRCSVVPVLPWLRKLPHLRSLTLREDPDPVFRPCPDIPFLWDDPAEDLTAILGQVVECALEMPTFLPEMYPSSWTLHSQTLRQLSVVGYRQTLILYTPALRHLEFLPNSPGQPSVVMLACPALESLTLSNLAHSIITTLSSLDHLTALRAWACDWPATGQPTECSLMRRSALTTLDTCPVVGVDSLHRLLCGPGVDHLVMAKLCLWTAAASDAPIVLPLGTSLRHLELQLAQRHDVTITSATLQVLGLSGHPGRVRVGCPELRKLSLLGALQLTVEAPCDQLRCLQIGTATSPGLPPADLLPLLTNAGTRLVSLDLAIPLPVKNTAPSPDWAPLQAAIAGLTRLRKLHLFGEGCRALSPLPCPPNLAVYLGTASLVGGPRLEELVGRADPGTNRPFLLAAFNFGVL
ncbi:hypothetical protein PAPYR_2056 [Paratrimastix pyriformis]|uniref:F-box domain-containing protein n=1 Tax=Paratrimastix pyriformis TaxID=342808 RepID=A0ABQ8UV93_9EUKA|nr:hypothetical protein PAPYR_2056 [Paratrimastix pyriformis]